jgi:c-di-GMP-binding flagellar brake protein YcgR
MADGVSRGAKQAGIHMSDANEARKDSFRLSLNEDVFVLNAVGPKGHEVHLSGDVRVKNISSGGMCILTEIELEKGTVIEAEIELEDVLNAIRAYCQTVWKSRRVERHQFQTGMKYIGLKDLDDKHLEDFLSKYRTNNTDVK